MSRRSVINKAGEQLKKDEGFSGLPYYCTSGKLTIGYGRNIEDNGISEQESELLLYNDITAAIEDLEQFEWYGAMTESQQAAIVNMRYQLGYHRFRKFKKTLNFLDSLDWQGAAREMLNSRWANQTPDRAKRVSKAVAGGN